MQLNKNVTTDNKLPLLINRNTRKIRSQPLDHAHTDSCVVTGCNLVQPRPCRFLRCDWLQPRATSQIYERVYFWLQSHRSIEYSVFIEQRVTNVHANHD